MHEATERKYPVGNDHTRKDSSHRTDPSNEFVCIDTLRAMKTNRVCGQNIIDNMSEQDAFIFGSDEELFASRRLKS